MRQLFLSEGEVGVRLAKKMREISHRSRRRRRRRRRAMILILILMTTKPRRRRPTQIPASVAARTMTIAKGGGVKEAKNDAGE
tara:strand:- start:194 stop:442 length:249 start_codon:yes stop_codon:yes gene_type:complete